MKKGNWKSHKAYKRDLNGCHRVGPPAGRIVPGGRHAPRRERSLGAIAMAIVNAAMNPFRRGKR
ncbi:MAG: hypothetical protein V3S12_01255 [Acidiferrobacterales bacterium]